MTSATCLNFFSVPLGLLSRVASMEPLLRMRSPSFLRMLPSVCWLTAMRRMTSVCISGLKRASAGAASLGSTCARMTATVCGCSSASSL